MKMRCSSSVFVTPVRIRQPVFHFYSARLYASFFMGVSQSPITILDRRETALSEKLERTPDAVTTEDYLVVLRGLAESKLPDAALRSERWLRRLEQTGSCAPIAECYQRVIEAWAGAISEDPARVIIRAEGWLRKYQHSEIESLQPDTACYNAFLNVCTKGRSFKGSHGGHRLVREHAEIAEKLLRFMIAKRQDEGPTSRVSPNAESFNLVIRGWTRCRTDIDLTDRAIGVHQLMDTYQSTIDSSVAPDSRTYGLIMDAIAVRAKLKMKKYKRCKGNDDPLKNGMEEVNLLRSILEIIHSKRASGVENIEPSTYSYNILLGCWASIAQLHDNATEEVESILRHMTSLKEDGQLNVGPDAHSYLMVMRAWLNSDKANRGQRISWLLSKQWKDFEFSGDENIRPTVDNYNLSIRAWNDLQTPKEAEVVMKSLLNQSEASGIKPLQPNTESYSLLIRAWIKVASKGSEVALKTAADWLDALLQSEKEETGVLSSAELYMAYFGAAKHCAEQSPFLVLRLVNDQFEKLKSSRHTLDPLHYSRVIQVTITALSKEVDDSLRRMALFKEIVECKEAGLVSGELIRVLAKTPIRKEGWTIEERLLLLQECFPQFPLPTSWTRNVRQLDLLPKQQDFPRNFPTRRVGSPGR